MEEFCSSVPELSVPVELPAAENIHHVAARFHRAQEEAVKAQLELNL